MIRPSVDERKQLRPETLETGWHISTRYCVSQRHIPWYIAYLMVFTIQFEQHIPVSQKFSTVKHKQPRNKRWTISWAEHSSVHCTASISCRRVAGPSGEGRITLHETVSHCHTLKTGLYRKKLQVYKQVYNTKSVSPVWAMHVLAIGIAVTVMADINGLVWWQRTQPQRTCGRNHFLVRVRRGLGLGFGLGLGLFRAMTSVVDGQ